MTALSESLCLTIICDVFSLLILTFLLFSWVGKPILDKIPKGILVSVVQCLQMFHIMEPHLFILTNDVGLGGVFSPTLIGLTPAALAQGMGVALPAPNQQRHQAHQPAGAPGPSNNAMDACEVEGLSKGRQLGLTKNHCK